LFTHPLAANGVINRINVLSAGNICRSGVAIFVNFKNSSNTTAKVAQCVNVLNITSSLDNYTSYIPSGKRFKECALANGTVSGNITVGSCRIDFDLNHTVQNISLPYNFYENCECTLSQSMNSQSTGICQMPAQTEINDYV
jgi:hypothetical protein